MADDVLRQGVQGISDLITVHGLINLDFADVRTVMKNAGSALMGIGRASGEDRAIKAAQQAIESPLLEVSIDGARGILFNVIGGNDVSMHEINAAAEAITSAADPDANIIFGATINPEIEGEIIITVVATGFDAAYFTKRAKDKPDLDELVAAEEKKAKHEKEPEMSSIDTNLDETSDLSTGAEDFHSEPSVPNIWSLDHDKDNDEQPDHDAERQAAADQENQIDEPSFLKRLRSRRKTKPEETDTNDQNRTK